MSDEDKGFYLSSHYQDYPEEVKQEMSRAIQILHAAYIYAQRVDWLLSGDDGEESFLSRLKEELEEAEARFENKLK